MGGSKKFTDPRDQNRSVCYDQGAFPAKEIEPYKIHTFQRELNIIRQINHKHIVRFLGHGKTSDILYLVFEFVDGPDLAKLIQSQGGRIGIPQALPLCFGILNGLAYAHHVKITFQNSEGKSQTFEGLVHRNLKPQNILVAMKGIPGFPKLRTSDLLNV